MTIYDMTQKRSPIKITGKDERNKPDGADETMEMRRGTSGGLLTTESGPLSDWATIGSRLSVLFWSPLSGMEDAARWADET